MKSPKEIGELLRDARRKKNVKMDAICKATHIQTKVIEALEEGRTEELLGRVYVVLFLRKYAAFLGLDADRLASDYKAFFRQREEEPPPVKIEPKRPLSERRAAPPPWIKSELFATTIFLTVFFILLFSVKAMFLSGAPEEKATAKTPKKPKSVTVSKAVTPEKAPEKPARRDAKPKPAPKKSGQDSIFPIPRDESLDLSLACSDEVWMKVKRDGRVIYVGTLNKGDKKNWSADKDIELWVGRAEALNFTINRNPIGKVGSGRIRSIRLVRNGLKVGNRWLFKAD